MSYTSVINKGPNTLAIIVDGKQIRLDANSQNVFPDFIAEAFQRKYGSEVVEFLDVSELETKEQAQESKDVWFANLSGNPDAPEEYEDEGGRDVNGSKITKMYKNPYKAPRAWREEMKGSMFFDDPNDPENFKWRSEAGSDAVFTNIDIPPFKIVKFKPHVADFIRRRNMNSSVMTANLAHLGESREPPSFRPDISWSLDDIRAYLILADPSYDTDRARRQKLGLTENEIRSRAKGDDTDVEQQVFEAKNALLTRVFFCIADPKIPLPSRTEFESFVARREADKRKKQLAKEQAIKQETDPSVPG